MCVFCRKYITHRETNAKLVLSKQSCFPSKPHHPSPHTQHPNKDVIAGKQTKHNRPTPSTQTIETNAFFDPKATGPDSSIFGQQNHHQSNALELHADRDDQRRLGMFGGWSCRLQRSKQPRARHGPLHSHRVRPLHAAQ